MSGVRPLLPTMLRLARTPEGHRRIDPAAPR
jgi:hypothetical protein